MVKTNFLHFDNANAFDMEINHAKIYSNDIRNNHSSHIHNECEIYINLTGDVSFMVEGTIYPVERGTVIITRPHEHHNCIYNNNELHDHYCMFFSSDGNEKFLDIFFERNIGENNRVQIPEKQSGELFDICEKLVYSELSPLEKQFYFYKLISLITDNRNTLSPKQMPSLLKNSISYINTHISEKITIQKLAKISHTSVNTLEYYFKENLGMTPSVYIKNQRLSLAARLLASGKPVIDVAYKCGFADCSYFISLFKKSFNITPLQYQKANQKK